MTRLLIGLVGVKGSGKSYVADYLQRTYDFRKYAVATPLKQIASIVGFTDEEIYGDKKEVYNPRLGIACREFMQVFGTDICRNELPRYLPNMRSGTLWCNLLSDYIEKDQYTSIVCDDIRFNDEIEVIKNHGGIIIQLQRNGVTENEYSNHASETQVLECDYTLVNDETIYNQLDRIIGSLKRNNIFLL